MKTGRRMPPLLKYELFNVLRGRWLLAYALLFGGISLALLQFSGDAQSAVASLMNVILLVIPIVSVLFAAAYWYNAEGFTLLLLTQPIRRSQIYLSRWAAISLALSGGCTGGITVALLLTGGFDRASALLLAMGTALTFIFVSLGLLTAVSVPDRMKGIGAAFMLWFYFAVVHDGLVFLFLSNFQEYPLESAVMILSAINPIDIVRISLLLAFDYGALMGYTGMLLQKALSGPVGFLLTGGCLMFWTLVPAWLGLRVFKRRDF